MTPDDIRAIALELPEAYEQDHWGFPSFRVRKKVFATVRMEGERQVTVVKATKEQQTALVSSEPETFQIAPGGIAQGWTLCFLDRADPEEIAELLTDAWRIVAPKTLVKAFDSADVTS